MMGGNEKESPAMTLMPAADELALVRTELARLRQREAALCQTLIAATASERAGFWTHASVIERRMRAFDPALLPRRLRDDPAYWSEQSRQSVICRPLGQPKPDFTALSRKAIPEFA
jgi:hypothetical protein